MGIIKSSMFVIAISAVILIVIGLIITLAMFSSPESFGMSRGPGGYLYDSEDYQKYLENKRNTINTEREEQRNKIIAEIGIEEQENRMVNEARTEEQDKINASLYEKWLNGYLEKGGKITHWYNHSTEMESSRWIIFERSTSFGDGSQPSDINIIALEGVKISIVNSSSGEPLGPNSIFFMDNFTHKGNWVPIFMDLEIN